MLTSTLEQKTFHLTKKVSIEMILCPPGQFMMGSPDNEKDRYPDEGPQSLVTIEQPFWLGKYPVTQSQWKAVMGNNPSHFKGPDNPVEQVSWFDCKEFVNKLDCEFDLPTEAQWEYGCRAGTTTRFFFGSKEEDLKQYGWYYDNSNRTHPVGQLKPNPWGFYDIVGNTWQWCQDIYLSYPYRYTKLLDLLLPKDSSRILRGGSWYGNAYGCRSAYRGRYGPGGRYGYSGFRLSRIV